jgi:glutaredoxin
MRGATIEGGRRSTARRHAPLIVLLIAAAAWFGWSRPPPPISCTQTPPDADTLVMLSASWCGYCRRARAFLHEHAIKHCEYDIERTPAGRRLFAAQAAKVIPVILVRGDTLVGFNREEILQTLAAHGLAGLE